MKKLLIVLVIICVTTQVVAQEDKQTKEFPNEDVRLLSLNPLLAFAFDTPRYRLGYTHGLSGHFRIGVEVGYGSENTSVIIFREDSENRDEYSLFEVLPQVTYILNPREKINHYLALQGFYLSHKEQFTNDGYFDTDLVLGISYDQADYERIKIGANLLYGIYLPIGESPFGLDIYTGFGVRSRKNTYSNLVNPVADPFFDDNSFFAPQYRENSGTTVGLNFSLGFKFTYNFNN